MAHVWGCMSGDNVFVIGSLLVPSPGVLRSNPGPLTSTGKASIFSFSLAQYHLLKESLCFRAVLWNISEQKLTRNYFLYWYLIDFGLSLPSSASQFLCWRHEPPQAGVHPLFKIPYVYAYVSRVCLMLAGVQGSVELPCGAPNQVIWSSLTIRPQPQIPCLLTTEYESAPPGPLVPITIPAFWVSRITCLCPQAQCGQPLTWFVKSHQECFVLGSLGTSTLFSYCVKKKINKPPRNKLHYIGKNSVYSKYLTPGPRPLVPIKKAYPCEFFCFFDTCVVTLCAHGFWVHRSNQLQI